MIVLKKIAFLQPLLLHAVPLMRFSEEAQREQLSVSAQKAAWATSIIKTISQASLPKTIRDPTLRDVILNLPDPSNKFEFQDGAKNEVMKLFTNGISLAKPFLAKRRRKAQQKGELHKSSAKKSFIFFPNRNVTTHMFNQLMRAPDQHQTNILLTGVFGICKTISIILFIYLSNHQTSFIYQASKDEKKQEQYEKLLKLQLIPDQVVKYWYYSVSNNTDKQIKQLILEQAVELEPAVRAELKKQPQLLEFIQILGQHYDIPGLSFRPIVDSVNIVAQLMRKNNQNLKKIKQTKPDHKAQAVALDRSFKSFLDLESYFTLITSVAIQKKLLERGYNNRLGMELVDSHTGIRKIHIPYENIVSTPGGKLDFWQTFWFEIERRANFSSTQLESAKQSFYQSIYSKNKSDTENSKTSALSVFSRYVYIRKFVDLNYSNLIEPIVSQNYQEVQKIITKFHSFCLQESKQKVKSFLQKGHKEHKQQILLRIYLKARSLKEKKQNRFQRFLLTIPQLDSILKDEIPSYKTPEVKILEYEEIRNDLRSLLVFQTKFAVKFIFTLQEFTILAEQVIFVDQSKYAFFLKSQIQKDQTSVSGVKKMDLGLVAEKYLINCLSNSSSLSFNALQKPSNITEKRHFKIYQTVLFDQLKTTKITVQGEEVQLKPPFEANFQTAIKTARKNPGKDILALPYVMQNGKPVRYVSQNQTIDFAILTYYQKLNRLEFESFDVTASHNLTQKKLQARKLFTDLFEGATSSQRPFSLIHTYICQKGASYQQQDIKNTPPSKIPFKFLYTDLQDLAIRTNNLRNLSMFKYIIQLITLDKKDKQYGALLLKHDC